MSVQPADIRVHVQRLLAEEQTQLERLQGLLQRESETLRGDDIAAIERIGAERHDCTSQLTRLDGERRELCRMLSHDNNRHGFEQLLRWCDASGDLHRQWVTNLATAKRCKEFNDRNGAVVSLRLNHVQKLLLAIRGGSIPPVYSPQLNGTAAFTPRELGRA